MAWVADADFNGLSDGDLNGQGGGSGWSGNWSGGTNYDVQGTTVYEGAKAVVGSNSGISRPLTTGISTDGNIVYVAARRAQNNSGQSYIAFYGADAATWRATIIMNSAGAIKSYPGGTTILASYSTNTWYVFKVTLNVNASTFDVDYSTGAYGSAGTFTTGASGIAMSNSGNINGVDFDLDVSGGGANAYFDYLSPTSPFTSPSSIKTVDGLAKASVKTVNGLAIASVKTINGLA